MRSIFEKFLLEDHLSEKFSDFKDSLSEEERQYIVGSDPSGKFKYADWIFKNIIQPARESGLAISEIRPPVAELKDTLSILFNKIKGEVSDINMYDKYDELLDTVRKYKMEDKARQFIASGVIHIDKPLFKDEDDLPEPDYSASIINPVRHGEVSSNVKYKLYHLNNRYGARKFYVNNGTEVASTKTSWCISTDIPSHWERETRHGQMIFIVAETDQPRPWNYLALRISYMDNEGVEPSVELDSVWNNDVGTNTSADKDANQIGEKIFKQEKVKIQEAWDFHFSEANKPFTEYDNAEEGEYSNAMVKRMIIARIEGRTLGGDIPTFNNDFADDNQEQVFRIFTQDIPLFLRWLRYCSKNTIEIVSPNTVEIPISKAMMMEYAERAYRNYGSKDTNWGELYMDENNGIGDKIIDWYWDTSGYSVDSMVDMLDVQNKQTIIELIRQGDPEDMVIDGDENIDISESLNESDPHDIVQSMRNSISSAQESSAYSWIVKDIRGTLEEYIGVKLGEWTPWNNMPLSARYTFNQTFIEEVLSMIPEGDYEMDSIDPITAHIFYQKEQNGPASLDTDRMDTYPEDKDFNEFLKDQLPAPEPPKPVKPKPKKRTPAKKKPIVTATDII
jgi:hypothetical protein